jgi:hypothetical protein
MATAERARARPQLIVFWPLRKPKTHMNITAVTPAQMVHAVESRVRQRRCQRCGGRWTSTSVSHRRGWYSDGPILCPKEFPSRVFTNRAARSFCGARSSASQCCATLNLRHLPRSAFTCRICHFRATMPFSRKAAPGRGLACRRRDGERGRDGHTAGLRGRMPPERTVVGIARGNEPGPALASARQDRRGSKTTIFSL